MLLSERNPDTYRLSHSRALPIGGPSKSAAILIPARRGPEDAGRFLWVPGKIQSGKTQREKTQRAKIASSQPMAGVDPLYLFLCGLSWCKCSDTSAGWELISCLHSSGQTARIAAAFLAQAKHVQLPFPDRVLAIDGMDKPSPQDEVGFQRSARRSL